MSCRWICVVDNQIANLTKAFLYVSFGHVIKRLENSEKPYENLKSKNGQDPREVVKSLAHSSVI